MPFDPTTAQLESQESTESSGFDPSTAQLETHIQPVGQDSNAVSIPAALTAGLSNAGASTIESTVDAGIWAANHLGLSDQKAAQYRMNVNQGVAPLRTSPNPQGDVFERAAAAHPYLAKGAELSTDAAGLMSANSLSGASKLGGAALGALSSAGASSPEQADHAALFGGAAGLVAPVLGQAVNKLSNAALNVKASPLYDKIMSNLSADTKDQAVKAEAAYTETALQQNNQNYSKLRAIPGALPDTDKIVNNLSSVMKTIPDAVKGAETNPQAKILATIQAHPLNNMEDAIDLRQYIASNKSAFQGKGATTAQFQSYNNLKSSLDTSISKKADQAGMTGAFDQANDFHKNVIVPLQASGATDRLGAVTKKLQQDAFSAKTGQQAPVDPSYTKALNSVLPNNPTPAKLQEITSRLGPKGGSILESHFVQQAVAGLNANPDEFKAGDALLKLNKLTDKYSSVLSKDSNNTLNGIKKVLQTQAAKTNPAATMNFLIGSGAGAAYGGTTGYEAGGVKGAMIGSAAGALGGAGAMKFGRGLIASPQGQAVLRKIAENPKLADTYMKALTVPSAAVNAPTSLMPDDTQ